MINAKRARKNCQKHELINPEQIHKVSQLKDIYELIQDLSIKGESSIIVHLNKEHLKEKEIIRSLEKNEYKIISINDRTLNILW